VLDGQVLLKGKIGERILEFTIHIDGKKQSSSSDDSLPVHRLAAKAQIQQLQDQEKGRQGSLSNLFPLLFLSVSVRIMTEKLFFLNKFVDVKHQGCFYLVVRPTLATQKGLLFKSPAVFQVTVVKIPPILAEPLSRCDLSLLTPTVMISIEFKMVIHSFSFNVQCKLVYYIHMIHFENVFLLGDGRGTVVESSNC